MFTGIITDIGTIQNIIPHNDGLDKTIFVQTHYDTGLIKLGDSVACSGVCLTVTDIQNDILSFDVSNETLSKTTLNHWHIGTKINLEQAMRVGDSLGGHHVTGHIDCMAVLTDMVTDGDSWRLTITPPVSFIKYLAPKGSVALDGTSLTINHTTDTVFDVNIIPHTQKHTIIQNYKVGQQINLEIDVTARYIVHYLQHFQKSVDL